VLSRNPGILKLLKPSGPVQDSTGINFNIYYLLISENSTGKLHTHGYVLIHDITIKIIPVLRI
jgi:hypothetical protein